MRILAFALVLAIALAAAAGEGGMGIGAAVRVPEPAIGAGAAQIAPTALEILSGTLVPTPKEAASPARPIDAPLAIGGGADGNGIGNGSCASLRLRIIELERENAILRIASGNWGAGNAAATGQAVAGWQGAKPYADAASVQALSKNAEAMKNAAAKMPAAVSRSGAVGNGTMMEKAVSSAMEAYARMFSILGAYAPKAE